MGVRLTPKRETFCRLVMEGKTRVEAYRVAYDCPDRPLNQVYSAAHKLATEPIMRMRVAELQRQAADASVITAAEMLKELLDVVQADATEIVRLRHTCCRFCHGLEHAYQWRDEEEWAVAVADTLEMNSKRSQDHQRPMPDSRGGFGFNFTLQPHSDCPRCRGEGKADVYIEDFRNLPPATRKLIAGFKNTAQGFEVKLHDKGKYWDMIGRILGAFKDNALTINNFGPTAVTNNSLPADPTEASKVYAQIMQMQPGK